jgi:hypothetical protein
VARSIASASASASAGLDRARRDHDRLAVGVARVDAALQGADDGAAKVRFEGGDVVGERACGRRGLAQQRGTRAKAGLELGARGDLGDAGERGATSDAGGIEPEDADRTATVGVLVARDREPRARVRHGGEQLGGHAGLGGDAIDHRDDRRVTTDRDPRLGALAQRRDTGRSQPPGEQESCQFPRWHARHLSGTETDFAPGFRAVVSAIHEPAFGD